MLRGMLLKLRRPWCVATTGSVLTSIVCSMVSSEACETLITMPSRFISRTTARPRSFSPWNFGGEQQESAKLLAQLCAESCAERSPSRYRSRSTAEVAVEIEAALEVQHRRDLARAVDALDIATR